MFAEPELAKFVASRYQQSRSYLQVAQAVQPDDSGRSTADSKNGWQQLLPSCV